MIPEAHLDQIENNRRNIVRFLHIEESLLNKLQAEKILSMDTANRVRKTAVDDDKNTAFLDYVMKLSQANLNRFIDILCDENQPHVAELFRYNQKGTNLGSKPFDNGGIMGEWRGLSFCRKKIIILLSLF